MDQDPWASSWKDQRHPTMGPNLMGLLTLRIRWDWKTICKCFIWKFSVSGGLGGLPGFQQERIGGGEVQQFAPFGATYCWARIFVQQLICAFPSLDKEQLLMVLNHHMPAETKNRHENHLNFGWKSSQAEKPTWGFQRKINWYTEKT